ncbi:MAG: acetyl-CoA carboxylase biotin carboxyl carrier protein [Acidobacteriota bacterium]
MLTFEQIKELLELVAERRLEGLKLERSGFKLKIDGQRPAKTQVTQVTAASAPPAVAAPVIAPAVVSAPEAVAAPAPAAEAEAGDDLPANAHIVNAPLVGTFYRKPNPDAPPFVDVGDTVKEGQVLCIVEAMKLMNDVESDAAGKIVKIFPEDAQPVEYGEPLFAVVPA